jgi:hypothetical protein
MQPIHLLTKMGILSAFSVAKKVTEDDVSKTFQKYKKIGKSDEEIGNIIKAKIYEEIQDALVHNKIPGLVTNGMEGVVNSNISMIELNKLIVIIAQKLTEKKYDKMPLCYFINSLVNLLALTEKDFERFHRKMSRQNSDDDDEDDDDD